MQMRMFLLLSMRASVAVTQIDCLKIASRHSQLTHSLARSTIIHHFSPPVLLCLHCSDDDKGNFSLNDEFFEKFVLSTAQLAFLCLNSLIIFMLKMYSVEMLPSENISLRFLKKIK